MFEWNPWALPALVVMVMAGVMAAAIYGTRPWRAQNRLLALAVALGGLSAGPYFGFRLLMMDPGAAWFVTAIGVTILIVSPLPYLLFLGTLETPLVRPLQSRSVQVAIVLALVALEAVWLLRPDLVLPTVEPFHHMTGWNVVSGPLLFPVALLPLFAAQIFGFIAAISAYRRATTPTQKAQAKSYAIAFGTRDFLGAVFIISFGVLGWHTTQLGEPIFSIGVAVIDGVFFLLLGYAILEHQLFDIHLKLKWSLGRGTVVAVLMSVFFLVKEGIEFVLPMEGLVPNLLGAGAVSVLVFPVWRYSIRFADHLMPDVQDTKEYRGRRKQTVYQAALAEAMLNGELSEQERRVLATLAQRLGLPDQELGAGATAAR